MSTNIENSHILNHIVWSKDETCTEIFTRIYDKNLWQSEESISGKGSELSSTKNLLSELPKLFQKYNIKAIIDAPCGDFHWMKHLEFNLEKYTGIDIVEKLILENKKYETATTRFFVGDILSYNFEKSDLILCRDCFIHLTFEQIFQALEQFKTSQSEYILLTNFDINKNEEVLTGQYRKINLMLPPFNFPKPLETVVEAIEDKKSISLWRLSEL